ncbi:MBL fold metallo-hydrolase [Desulfosarcina ovata]|uniref:Metallo-beta-lactamase domain-containing protein n=1 Tax=Desulfosarcina ovata subsp. ovata TaxID=2752305 RepID=A0A5K8ADZ2_9BACT|nr:MBL fold metallo-hydrolase [Desulfosarcina ovata]BBO90781.1 hypothetical protein DSCOOX_39610 [Desulfosarcina ovata subsp. ovata]
MNRLETLPFVHPVTPHIYLACGPGKGRFPNCHGYLLLGDRTILIDSGIGTDRIRQIDQTMRIDGLIISHSHPDHILAWHGLRDRQLWLPAETPETVEDLILLGRRFVEGEANARYWTDVVRDRLGIQPLRQPNHRFDDGERLDFGAIQLRAIHAPGHLDDHYCFLETTSKTLFTTDVDFTGFGPWYGNPESDIRRFRESVMMLRSLAYDRVGTSHKRPMDRNAADRAFARYLEAFERQKMAVRALCATGMDLEAMIQASPFYHNRMADIKMQRIFESQMIRKNLELLLDEGGIVEKQGRFFILDE